MALRRKYQNDVAKILGVNNPSFDKVFKSQLEAKNADVAFDEKILDVRNRKEAYLNGMGGEVLFKDFFTDVFWESYVLGSTSSYPKPPTEATVANAASVFRLHILPLFGEMPICYMNDNPAEICRMLERKANEYANFKNPAKLHQSTPRLGCLQQDYRL